jgi:3-deoxy-D-manno-octulosonic-acid transferase
MRPAARVAPGPVPLWYTLAWLLVLPLAAGYLLWRAARQPAYLSHWRERFLGRAPTSGGGAGAPVFWLHAVSVGETRAAQPLIESLARRHEQARFVLTHMTPTGRAAGLEVARALPGRVQQRYLPYDLPFAARRFLREARPRLGILMETEIWPNLLQAAREAGVPVVLANGRLSQRSLDRALRHARLLRAAAAGIAAVGAQAPADAARIGLLYAGPVIVTGNVKFDRSPEPAQIALGSDLRARLRARFAPPQGERPIWLFASTRAGEERLILQALQARAAQDVPAPLLLFVPRHPQRFEEVAELLRAQGAALLRRADFAEPPVAQGGAVPVLLGDSMGEMALYYAMADVALIGGSLLPLGGQNLIEACACACPVVLGPHMFNFAQAADDAAGCGAAVRAADAGAALGAMARIAADPAQRARMAQAGADFWRAHRGATARTVELIECLLEGRPLSAAAAN